jgi:hypothetical protein
MALEIEYQFLPQEKKNSNILYPIFQTPLITYHIVGGVYINGTPNTPATHMYKKIYILILQNAKCKTFKKN